MAINDGPCLKVANCTGGTPYCGTSRVNGLAMTYMNKFCSAACINASQNFTIISATETCCTTDLCNNDKLGDANSMFADNGGSGLAGGAFLLVTICGLLSAIFTM
ncbi:prostate stem cell antigen-like [Leptodactylus fuscus]